MVLARPKKMKTKIGAKARSAYARATSAPGETEHSVSREILREIVTVGEVGRRERMA